MDAKRQLLDDTLRHEFDMGRFIRFTKEFFNNAELVSPDKENDKVWAEYSYHINSYTHVAKYKDVNKNNVIILAIKLKKGRAVDKARSLQRNFVSKLISDTKYDAAIVAFYSADESTWRLSFVRLNVEFDSGKVKTTLTPAKRYSYLVGKGEPTHTAQERLYPIFKTENFNPTLDSIEEAFSVEAVTKDFFEKYKEKYLKLKEYLDTNEIFVGESKRCQFTSEQFAKKLMGQLAFLYFLQKKGWLGVKVVPHILTEKQYKNAFFFSKASRDIIPRAYQRTGEDEYRLRISVIKSNEFSDEDADILAGCFKAEPWGSGTKTFIREIFDACQKNKDKNFLDDFLEPLFYQALNHQRGKNDYYKMFNCKIPFLNGGLFDAIENYDWKRNKFEIPNELFSNINIKGKDDADGILDIFDRYNFTMNEDEPLEKEVAVDPEMLGKIFENLLDVKDRKSKGAFYTPREIVHYMCQESLIKYLVNTVKVPYEDIKAFILYGELMKDEDCSTAAKSMEFEKRIPKSVYDKLYQIDRALQNVKVADPAVGSGAFPLGMLNEIVRARLNITEYLVRQISNDDNGYQRKLYRISRHPYKIKWDTIKNCIFAVDIEHSAVDIAKLRLWLSIVVEQEIDEENPYPHALPNLDCNIMCGNSLIDEFEGIKLFDEGLLSKEGNGTFNEEIAWQLSMFEDQIKNLIDELFSEQDRLFGEDDPRKKIEIKDNIDRLIDSIIRVKLSRDNNNSGLKKYEETIKRKTKPYFLWYLEFGKIFKENGGFDIVIGNPPYVGESGNKDIFRPIASTSFGQNFYRGKMDLYYFFFHLGINISKTKGIISFITTNYYLNADGASKLREDFRNRVNISRLINFNELRIFETARGQHNMITILEKSKDNNIEAHCCITNKKGNANTEQINNIIYWRDVETTYFVKKQSDLYDNNGNILFYDDDSILLKMQNKSNYKISDIDIGNGIDILQEFVTDKHIEICPELTKGEGIFALTTMELENLNLSDDEKKIIKPYYVSEQIKKYYVSSENTKWIIYTDKEACGNIHKYPNISKHLDKFSQIMTSDNKPYGLHRAREEKLFKGQKLLSLRMTKEPYFTFTDIDTYVTRAYLIIKPNDGINLKYLLALLNSKLFHYWFYMKGKRKGQQLQIDKQPIENAPILLADASIQEEIALRIEDLISNLKRNDNDAEIIKNEIDLLVFSVYGITSEEIKFINNWYESI